MNTDSTTPLPSVYAIGTGLGLLVAGAATAFFAWYSLITTTVVKAASIFASTAEDPTAGAKAFLVTGGVASVIGALVLIVGIVQLAQGVDYLVRSAAPARPAESEMPVEP